jgi:hypothetical protein
MTSYLANNPVTDTLVLTDMVPTASFTATNVRAGVFPAVQYVNGEALMATNGLLTVGTDSLVTAQSIIDTLGINANTLDYANIINISLAETTALSQDINFGTSSATTAFVSCQNTAFGATGPTARLFKIGDVTPKNVMVAVNVTNFGATGQRMDLVWTSA